MNEFLIWFSTGAEHILDIGGYDHILYISLLTVAFPPGQWKKLLLLVTAFTLGHSFSLALAVSGTFHFPQPAVEFLIALSIFATALYQLAGIIRIKHTPLSQSQYPSVKDHQGISERRFFYIITVFFGLIHGLGFSFLLKAMLGSAGKVFWPLLYFNLGLEAGQLIIVCFILLFFIFLSQLIKLPYFTYKLFLVCTITIIAIKITAERFLFLFFSS
jgi:hypothetical protein